MNNVKHMDVAEFREHGYLQEVNRQVLHPCGLALEVEVADEPVTWLGLSDENVQALKELLTAVRDNEAPNVAAATKIAKFLAESKRRQKGEEFISGIWDYREDEEGIVYDGQLPDASKVRKVLEAREPHEQARTKLFGEVIQPPKRVTTDG